MPVTIFMGDLLSASGGVPGSALCRPERYYAPSGAPFASSIRTMHEWRSRYGLGPSRIRASHIVLWPGYPIPAMLQICSSVHRGATCCLPSNRQPRKCCEDDVKELPSVLRWYLWAMYATCTALVVQQGMMLVTGAGTGLWRGHLSVLGAVVVFALLTYAGERATLQGTGP